METEIKKIAVGDVVVANFGSTEVTVNQGDIAAMELYGIVVSVEPGRTPENDTVCMRAIFDPAHPAVRYRAKDLRPLFSTGLVSGREPVEMQHGEAGREQSRESKTVQLLGEALNSYSFSDKRFAQALSTLHPTLQQSFFRTVKACILFMSDARNVHIDDRNRASHSMCKELAEIVEGMPLPLI